MPSSIVRWACARTWRSLSVSGLRAACACASAFSADIHPSVPRSAAPARTETVEERIFLFLMGNLLRDAESDYSPLDLATLSGNAHSAIRVTSMYGGVQSWIVAAASPLGCTSVRRPT